MQGYKVKHIIRQSNLKRKRIERHLLQSELSELSGVPLKTIGNLEQQRRSINRAQAQIVYALASALNCQMEDLLDVPSINKKNGTP